MQQSALCSRQSRPPAFLQQVPLHRWMKSSIALFSRSALTLAPVRYALTTEGVTDAGHLNAEMAIIVSGGCFQTRIQQVLATLRRMIVFDPDRCLPTGTFGLPTTSAPRPEVTGHFVNSCRLQSEGAKLEIQM
jgi:hypothetical protein